MCKETSWLCKEPEKAVKFSPYFWHFTLQTHYQAALVYLHRIYDQETESFNLHRFLFTVQNNHPDADPEDNRFTLIWRNRRLLSGSTGVCAVAEVWPPSESERKRSEKDLDQEPD